MEKTIYVLGLVSKAETLEIYNKTKELNRMFGNRKTKTQREKTSVPTGNIEDVVEYQVKDRLPTSDKYLLKAEWNIKNVDEKTLHILIKGVKGVKKVEGIEEIMNKHGLKEISKEEYFNEG